MEIKIQITRDSREAKNRRGREKLSLPSARKYSVFTEYRHLANAECQVSMPKALGQKESIEISHLTSQDSSSREHSSAYIFDTPVSYEVNYWLLGYRPACVACRCVCKHVRSRSAFAYLYVYALTRARARVCVCMHTHTRVRPVPYRNSQFARAFTFEFPLFTFRIVVVCLGTTR